MTRNPIDVTETDGNGYKRYLSDYPETISAEIGGLYEEPKLWRDMTPEEKGALLLAHHEGMVIECMVFGDLFMGWCPIDDPLFAKQHAYRIKPKVEVVVLENDRNGGWSFYEDSGTYKNTHRITFNTIDGKPDPTSIKMEEI